MADFYKFPMLPFEISLYIHKLKIDSATNIIINKWYNYIHKKVIAITLINNITSCRDPIYNYNPYINNSDIYPIYNYNPYIYHNDNRLLKILRFCDKILSGNEDKVWWKNKISLILSLFIIQINNNNACINEPAFMDILLTCEKLYKKFDNNTNIITNIITNNITHNFALNYNYNNFTNNFSNFTNNFSN